MNNLADKITAKIEKENIKPTPKWQFLLKDYLLWSVFGLNILLGAMFFVVTIFSLQNNDWDIYKYLDQNFLEHIIITMPYLRIGALGLFIFLAYYNYKHTDKGYKHRNRWIITMSLVITMLIGGTLFVIGTEDKIEKVFSKNLPYYNNLEERRTQMWHHPGRGLLGGEITKVVNEEGILLRDCHNKKWRVNLQNATWRGPIREAEVGLKIKIIGEEIDDDKFEAKEIRPWNGRRRRGLDSKIREHRIPKQKEGINDEHGDKHKNEHGSKHGSKQEYEEVE